MREKLGYGLRKERETLRAGEDAKMRDDFRLCMTGS